MTKTPVKRSPYKVGQVLNHHAMTEIIKGRPIPSCAGFKVTFVEKLGHTSGGYIIGLEGRRAINGQKVEASFVVTFPSFRKKTRKAYHSAFRYFVGDTNNPVKHVNIPRSTTTKREESKVITKTVTAGDNRKKMLLIDFLEV